MLWLLNRFIMNVVTAVSCFALLLLATSSAQDPKPCYSPPLLSGGMTVIADNGNIMSAGTISLDNFSQRVRVTNYVQSSNVSSTIDILMLFKEKVYYEINWSKFTCQKKPLSADFIPMHVPADAKFNGRVVLGSSSSWGMGVLVNDWVGTLQGNIYYSAVFTEVGCIPMTYMSNSPSGSTFISTFNWVLGTTDPMSFIPPYICSRSALDESEETANFFTIVSSLAKKKEE